MDRPKEWTEGVLLIRSKDLTGIIAEFFAWSSEDPDRVRQTINGTALVSQN